ncbi:MAG TPA: potassium/proton antiporter [Ilumatobacteraceae bacterium]|nr:potassium/proton antiporter [Ilumatobacteraceae bacterium]
MHSTFAVDAGILLGAVLVIVGVVGSGIAERFRLPGLVLFLLIGMVVADDGLAIVHFDDARLAQNIAVVALVVILFEGGLATAPQAVRRSGVAAALLATVGVAVTAAVVAGGAALVFDLPAPSVLLIGAVVSSTDAAAVFSALRGLPMPARVRDVLQMESGLNDPIAVILTIGMVEVWRGTPGVEDWLAFGLLHLVGGLAIGLATGVAARVVLRQLRLPNTAAYPVLALAVACLAYGLASELRSSGFLAVYLAGLVLGRKRRLARALLHFHEGLATAAEALLFLMLGLLVFPSNLADDIAPALVIATILMFVARPVAVAICLPWFRYSRRELTLISWAGLRGAVPIVLATIPLTAGHPEGELIFEVVFVTVLVSLVVQAGTVRPLVNRLGFAGEVSGAHAEVAVLDALVADLVELRLTNRSSVLGTHLRDHQLPEGSRVALVVRGSESFVPDGDMVLTADDVLLIAVTPDTNPETLTAWATRL